MCVKFSKKINYRPVITSSASEAQSNPQRLGNYYRFCTGASQVFSSLDYYVGDRTWRWLMKKHKKLHRKRTRLVRLPSLLRPTRKLWREGKVEQFLLSMLRVERFRRGWMRTPAYIGVPGEPDA